MARAALAQHPAVLLVMASWFYSVIDDRWATKLSRPEIGGLLETLATSRHESVNIFGYAMSRLVGSADERRLVDSQIGASSRALPGWLRAMDRASPTGVAGLLQDERELVTIAVGVRFADGAEATLLVDIDLGRVDTLIGIAVKPEPMRAITKPWVLGQARTAPVEITPAEARAQVESAIQWAEFHPHQDSQEWLAGRAFTEWVIGMLPVGGRPLSDRLWRRSRRD